MPCNSPSLRLPKHSSHGLIKSWHWIDGSWQEVRGGWKRVFNLCWSACSAVDTCRCCHTVVTLCHCVAAFYQVAGVYNHGSNWAIEPSFPQDLVEDGSDTVTSFASHWGRRSHHGRTDGHMEALRHSLQQLGGVTQKRVYRFLELQAANRDSIFTTKGNKARGTHREAWDKKVNTSTLKLPIKF